MTNLLTPVSVKPQTIEANLLLTLDTAVSHHDPAVADKSNTLLFNRQKQILARAQFSDLPTQEQITRICRHNPVTAELAEIFNEISFAEFAACAIVRVFLDQYNAGEGAGIFSGRERYPRLETRLRLAATKATSLRGLWNILCRDLQVEISASEEADSPLFALFALKRGGHELVLQTITTDFRSIVTLARFWHQQLKLQSESYAAKAAQNQTNADKFLEFSAENLPRSSAKQIVLEVPAVSSNSLRHEIVRAPGMTHLFGTLGFTENGIGKGELPASVEAIFYNGGNIAAGAKQPSNPHTLAARIREKFPLLELIGGVTDSFDVGESRLSVASWLVARENGEALKNTTAAGLPNLEMSAFDFLDEVTATRQGGHTGLGQMIYNFETLAAGTQIFVRLCLKPFTRSLTQGAFLAAIETYLENMPKIAGQSARGFGNVRGEWLKPLADGAAAREEYEKYLAENKDELREWMVGGTLGSGATVLT